MARHGMHIDKHSTLDVVHVVLIVFVVVVVHIVVVHIVVVHTA